MSPPTAGVFSKIIRKEIAPVNAQIPLASHYSNFHLRKVEMQWQGAKIGGKVSFKVSYCTSNGDYCRSKFPSEKPGAVL